MHFGLTHEQAAQAIGRSRSATSNLLRLLNLAAPVQTMLLAGDELRRSQLGNNNAYCQDNAVSWLNWELLDTHRDIHTFTRELIALRRAHPVLSRDQYYAEREINWFASNGGLPDWQNAHEHVLGCLVHEENGAALLLLFNAGESATTFVLPHAPGEGWQMLLETAEGGGRNMPPEATQSYRLPEKGAAILWRPA